MRLTVGRGSAVLLLVALAVLGLRAGEGFDPGTQARSLPGGAGLWIGLPLALGLLILITLRSGISSLLGLAVVAAVCVGVIGLLESGTGDPEPLGRAQVRPEETVPAEDGGEADLWLYLGLGCVVVLAAVVAVVTLLNWQRVYDRLQRGGAVISAREDVVPEEEEDDEPVGEGTAPAPPPVPREGDPGRDHRGAVIAAYAALEGLLSRAARVTRRPAETPAELLRRARRKGLPTADAEELSALYAAARYSTRPVTGDDSERAGRVLRRQVEAWEGE